MNNKKLIFLVFTDVTDEKKEKEKKLKTLMEKLDNHLMHITSDGAENKPISPFPLKEKEEIQIYVFKDNESLTEPLIGQLEALKDQYTFFGAFHNGGLKTQQNINKLFRIIESHQKFPRDTSKIQRIISDLSILSSDQYKQNFPVLTKELNNEIGLRARINKSLELLHLGLSIRDINASPEFERIYDELIELFSYDSELAQQNVAVEVEELRVDYDSIPHKIFLKKLRNLLLKNH